jgi:hypothetical protein
MKQAANNRLNRTRRAVHDFQFSGSFERLSFKQIFSRSPRRLAGVLEKF